MPFRLLGLAAHPDDAGSLCGRAFQGYAESGTEVTLVCAAAPAANADLRGEVRRLGVRDLVLLDYRREELEAAALEGIFADVIRSVRPHVVVADVTMAAIKSAAASAVRRVRTLGGSATLPAKLYYRQPAGDAGIGVTTRVRIPGSATPELFVRAFPDPWVTGIVERDLFAGIAVDAERVSGLEERIVA